MGAAYQQAKHRFTLPPPEKKPELTVDAVNSGRWRTGTRSGCRWLLDGSFDATAEFSAEG
jgi:hypothetical protein